VNWWRLPVLAAIVLASVLALGCGGGDKKDDDTTTIQIHYSRFLPGSISVPAGVPVTFTLRNDDPIAHEWIVGTEDVHERHRSGTEPYHDQVPTEVTVPALATRLTTLTFEAPGEYAFICHLPGHEAYGMRGSLTVVAN
jgi:uncharacterized cupredoxin-like copper-binding protein